MTNRDNYHHSQRRALPKGNEIYSLMNDLHQAFVSRDYARVISLRHGEGSGLDPDEREALKVMRNVANVVHSRMIRCKKTDHKRKGELELIAAKYLVH
jgi:hypothetical protein